jgi:nucleotide-binding universal stress UspA family protein
MGVAALGDGRKKMKILCPTDFSPPSHVAVQVALALAEQTAGTVELSVAERTVRQADRPVLIVPPGTEPRLLELCYVHEHSPPLPPSPYARAEGRLSDTDRASFVSQLRALVPADAERRGITTHVAVIDGGKAAQEILRAAERFTVDAIVLGAHGRGAAYRALVGSVSAEVVRLAHHPVLVVPRSKETS